VTEYERAANEKRGHILEQIEDAGILDRMGAYDRQLLIKLLVWDEVIVDEFGKIAG
jgi:predicted Ser/Thr protein kinase